MVIPTRTKFAKQLSDMQSYLIRYKGKCASDIRAAGLAATGDEGAREGVISGRKDEDRLRSVLEDNCLDAMLMQQPLIGDDLRFVSGTFRIVSDLSHIDSMTRDIAFLVNEIPAKAAGKFTAEFSEMSEQAATMVEKAVDAFVNSDAESAHEVVNADNLVNSLYAKTEERLVKLIREGKSSAQYLPELLMVAKYFERIGDLAKRVAAWAVFRVTGEHVVEAKPSQVADSEL